MAPPVITATQWGEHKQHILSLYVEKNWPLRLVRQELAAQGFEPPESQYRSQFKKWKVHKHGMLKTAKTCSRSDEPIHMSDIMAAQEASPPLRLLTTERTNPLHHSPLNSQEAVRSDLTGVIRCIGNNDDNYDWDSGAIRCIGNNDYNYNWDSGVIRCIGNNDDNYDWDSAGLGESFHLPITNAGSHLHHDGPLPYRMQIDGLVQDSLYAQDHVGPLSDEDQNSFGTGWDGMG